VHATQSAGLSPQSSVPGPKSLSSLAAAAGGRLVCGKADATVRGIFTDTRTPLKGGLFVALRGENFDGNAFAREAITRLGAAAVLIDNPEAAETLPKNAGAILVQDSRDGYLGIAAQHRRELNPVLFFGVTGSVGKSTTKEMLSHILEHGAAWNVHKAKGSFNNAVGLSHTILEANRQHQAAVLELGTNHPGEIKQLAAVARPQIAVITCAAESHLEAFGTVANVAREKATILAFQNERDIAVLNADDPHFEIFKRAAPGRTVTFGTHVRADFSVRQLTMQQGMARFLIRHGDDIAECNLRVAGNHQAMNAAAAIAAACCAGRSLLECAAAINTFEGVARRFAMRSVRGVTLIDDAYNANPASFRSALATLKSMTALRKFVVAGDMLELGESAPALHKKLGHELAECGLHRLLTVGKLAALSGEAALTCGLKPSQWLECATPELAAQKLNPLLEPGDVVLIKGSHGIHLERCIQRLYAESPREYAAASAQRTA
jgi:UDP-N-acetylmuramoyl-tripeptide--D-alanyl-D-alanine ligase